MLGDLPHLQLIEGLLLLRIIRVALLRLKREVRRLRVEVTHFLQDAVGHYVPERFPLAAHELDQLWEPEDPDPNGHLVDVQFDEAGDVTLVF